MIAAVRVPSFEPSATILNFAVAATGAETALALSNDAAQNTPEPSCDDVVLCPRRQ